MFRILKVFLCAFASIFVCANLFSEICEDEISKIKLGFSAPIEELLLLEQSLYFKDAKHVKCAADLKINAERSYIEKAQKEKNIETKITETVENVENKNPDYQIRALELSLYYQGFTGDILGTFDNYDESETPLRTYNEVPRDTDLAKPIQIRDADKAFKYAQIAYAYENFTTLKRTNLANLYLNGIGVAKDQTKAIQYLEINSKDFTKKFLNSSRTQEEFKPLFAYMYYKGIGFEKNIDKVNEILDKSEPFAWRNFYCGYLVPKDVEFAIYCLERRTEFWAAKTLSSIYSGKYLNESYDSNKAEYWAKVAEERLKVFYAEEYKNALKNLEHAEKITSKIGRYVNLAIIYGVEKFYFSNDWLYENIPFENPFFDMEKALKYLDELDKEYAQEPKKWKKISVFLKQKSDPLPKKIFPGKHTRYEGEIFKHLKLLSEKYKKFSKEK